MILLCCSSFGQHSNGTTQPLYNGRAREGLPVTSALVLLGAVTFTLMAAYQWAGRLGLWNAGPDGQVRALSTALAILFWLILVSQLATSRLAESAARPTAGAAGAYAIRALPCAFG